jgi:predicted helicase
MGDRLRPDLWHVDCPNQVYLTSLLSTVLGNGPAAMVSALVPDLHHFRGSFGGKDVIPLWRDSSATQPNITEGLLETLVKDLGAKVTAKDFFAYCYAVLSTPVYADRYSEDLSVPGPRIPITRDAGLFTKAVEIGQRLIALHTYGERFVHSEIPQGKARVEKAINPVLMPEKYDYDEAEATIHIGGGEIRPISKAVWEFSVSGYTILQRWLDFRMAKGAGKQSSELDKTRPETWPPEWTTELLELVWVLESTVELLPEVGKLFEEIVAGSCFDAEELPMPTDEEKKPPKIPTAAAEQGTLFGD